MSIHKFFIEISYKGTHYHGWQIQANADSVQEKLQIALGTLLRKPIELTGCGRTDTGVHALQHYSHFLCEQEKFSETFIHQLNSILPLDIAVMDIFPVHKEAHARFDAVSRTYEYRLYFKKDPFLKGFTCYCPYMPQVEIMRIAAEILKEYVDFSCFSKTHTQVKTNICHVLHTEWVWEKDTLIFLIEADRFLRNMVRAIVGTLLRVGWGEISLSDFRVILESKDRSKAGASVAPEGLYLKSIQYPFDLMKSTPYDRIK
jgi:tRNA pseudouridine38-40 synthase